MNSYILVQPANFKTLLHRYEPCVYMYCICAYMYISTYAYTCMYVYKHVHVCMYVYKMYKKIRI